MLKQLLVLVLLGATVGAYAGNENGNGGDGVVINGKIYLLDLVEAGVHRTPSIQGPAKPFVSDQLKASLAFMDTASRELVAKKISDIGETNYGLALALMMITDSYFWRIVEPDLVNIPDEDSVLDFKGLTLVQLAIRRGNVIRINEALWLQLEPAQKAALVLHELAYALVQPEKETVGEAVKYRQISSYARDLVGYIFSEDLLKRGEVGLKKVAGNHFPLFHASAGSKQLFDLDFKNSEINFAPSFAVYSGIIQEASFPMAQAIVWESANFSNSERADLAQRSCADFKNDGTLIGMDDMYFGTRLFVGFSGARISILDPGQNMEKVWKLEEVGDLTSLPNLLFRRERIAAEVLKNNNTRNEVMCAQWIDKQLDEVQKTAQSYLQF